MQVNPNKFPDIDKVIWYDLSEYKPLLKDFWHWAVFDSDQRFVLGEDNSGGHDNLWKTESPEVNLMAALFDSACLHFLETEHPHYKNKGLQFQIDKDGWLTTPETWQHVRRHTHLAPFVSPESERDLVTVFYAHLDESITVHNGCFEIYDSPNPEAQPKIQWCPKEFNLIIMTPDIWHRAKPFTGQRYSFATDVKIKPY